MKIQRIQAFNKVARNQMIYYKIHGYWSLEYIKVNTIHKYVDWSCSGRDYEEEPSDLIAAQCFALAVADAVNEIEKI